MMFVASDSSAQYLPQGVAQVMVPFMLLREWVRWFFVCLGGEVEGV